MLLPMLGFIFVLGVGGAFTGLVFVLMPRWRLWSVLAVVPVVTSASMLALALALVSLSDDLLGFFIGYAVGGILGVGLDAWLAYTIWRFWVYRPEGQGSR